MSQNEKKDTNVKLEGRIAPRFSLRQMWSWGEPGLIVHVDQDARAELRDLFDIHWNDFDIRMSKVEECVRTGSASDPKRYNDRPFSVSRNLRMLNDGVRIEIEVIAKTNLPKSEQLVDANGYPRKWYLERVLPDSCLQELFNLALVFKQTMRAMAVSQRAVFEENEAVFANLNRAIEFGMDTLNEVSPVETLTVPLGEAANPGRKDKKKDRKKGGGEEKTEAVVDGPTDDVARRLAAAATGFDPDADDGAGEADEASSDDVMPEGQSDVVETQPTETGPTVVSVPAPAAPKAPKAAKPPKKPAIKLGTKAAADALTALGATPPADGSNGQSS